jgi:hypothetical protein
MLIINAGLRYILYRMERRKDLIRFILTFKGQRCGAVGGNNAAQSVELSYGNLAVREIFIQKEKRKCQQQKRNAGDQDNTCQLVPYRFPLNGHLLL